MQKNRSQSLAAAGYQQISQDDADQASFSDTCDRSDRLDAEISPTPLPYGAIAALCLGRVAEGILFSLIFPYINSMIHELGVPEKDVGKWSALAVSIVPGLTD